MALNVRESQVGDITVLRLAGKVILGEGDVMLRNVIFRLVKKGGKRKFILEMGDISYIDSSGLGALVSIFTVIRRSGGVLVLTNLTTRIRDLLTITKMLTVYTVSENLEEAIAGVLNDVYGICPLYRCGSLLVVPNLSVENLTCAFCGTEILLKPSIDPNSNKNQLAIASLRIPVYDEESLDVSGGFPTTFKIDGRLDLFVSEAVERAWYTIPQPRRVLFDLCSAKETSRAGLKTLLNLCAVTEENGRGAIMYRKVSHEVSLVRTSIVYERKDAAIASLGKLSQGFEWNLTFGSFQRLKDL